VVVISGCGGAGVGSPHAVPPRAGAAARSAARTAPPLRVVASTRLPAAVQLPAVAALGNDALALGGLDALDTSVASMVRIGAGGASVVGVLPRALHDAAAASIDGQAYMFGGGNGASASDSILQVEGAS